MRCEILLLLATIPSHHLRLTMQHCNPTIPLGNNQVCRHHVVSPAMEKLSVRRSLFSPKTAARISFSTKNRIAIIPDDALTRHQHPNGARVLPAT
jgi:hypothetical protein